MTIHIDVHAGAVPGQIKETAADFEALDKEVLNFATDFAEDLHTPLTNDPTNYLIFDCGHYDPKDFPTIEENVESSWWMRHADTSGFVIWSGSDYLTDKKWHNPGGYLADYESVDGGYLEFRKLGGPRNLPYGEIDSPCYFRLNNGVPETKGDVAGNNQIFNQAWRDGAAELTIRIDKQNCTIFSGLNLPENNIAPTSVSSLANRLYGRTLYTDLIQTGKADAASQYVTYAVERGFAFALDEKAVAGSQTIYDTANVGAGDMGANAFLVPDPTVGHSLFRADGVAKYMALKVVNGVLQFTYKRFWGIDEKDVVLTGTTNIVDGNWHHIVVNRPTPFTPKHGQTVYGGQGCFEIWIDGKLEIRSYEITRKDIIPTVQCLFNDMLNPGIMNDYRFAGDGGSAYSQGSYEGVTANAYTPEWLKPAIDLVGFEGGIREFIFRQSYSLSPDDINRNHTYSIIHAPHLGGRIVAPRAMKNSSAILVQPNVTTNKKTVLKLYWDNLINNKEKNVNGLEFDETYEVHSYSVSRKTISSPTQVFNIDLTDLEKTPFYYENVKTAVNNFVNILAPGRIMYSSNQLPMHLAFAGISGKLMHMDPADYGRIIAEQATAGNVSTHVSNILYGGHLLQPGERVLLTGQYNSNENNVYIFNGPDKPLTQPAEYTAKNLTYAHVYVEEGKYAGKTFVQTEKVKHIRRDKKTWLEIDSNAQLGTIGSYPIKGAKFADSAGNQRLLNVLQDIDTNYDIIAFMNYPETSEDIIAEFDTVDDIAASKAYKDFINNIKTAVTNGKSLYVSSPLLAVDLELVSKITYVSQMLEESGDGQSAAISPFEGSGEPATNYYDTHRNNRYRIATTLNGLTDIPTYIMTDFITHSPDRTNSDYHVKYAYRPSGLQQGNEFMIPGLTTLPETINEQLPTFIYNQKQTKDLVTFLPQDINSGILGYGNIHIIAKLSNNIYTGSTITANAYNDNAVILAGSRGSGKVFVNCVENGYAFSRDDYNTGFIQAVTSGLNGETTATAAWQYSTKRLNKQNLYDFSEVANVIGQTMPSVGGGGAAIQAQSHCSNGVIRNKSNKDDLQYYSDLYPDATEEYFTTTQIPVYSMTWLGLKWLGG